MHARHGPANERLPCTLVAAEGGARCLHAGPGPWTADEPRRWAGPSRWAGQAGSRHIARHRSLRRIGRPQTQVRRPRLGGPSRWAGQAGHNSGRVISPAPMRTLTRVSASGPGPEWRVEGDAGSAGPAAGWRDGRPTCPWRGDAHARSGPPLCRLGLATVATAQGGMRRAARVAIRWGLSGFSGRSSSRPTRCVSTRLTRA